VFHRVIMGFKWHLVFLGVILLGYYTVSEETFPKEEEISKARHRRQSGCTDIANYCSQWPDKYCQDYKDYMKKNCARKCGYCSGPTTPPPCTDQSQHCSGWKASGFCASSSQWHSYMKTNCPKTCGFCGGGGGGGGGGGDCSGNASNKLQACKFDTDTCDWQDVPFDDDFDFQLTSSSTSNGPSSGHGGSGGYLVAKGNGKAQLLLPLEIILPHSQTATSTMCLRFQYSIGSGGSLKVFEIKNMKGQGKRQLLSLSGGSDKNWKCGKTTVNVSTKYQVMLEANSKGSTVAIDEVSFADGSCK